MSTGPSFLYPSFPGKKQMKMIYSEGHTRQPIRNIPTAKVDRERFCLSDEQVLNFTSLFANNRLTLYFLGTGGG